MKYLILLLLSLSISAKEINVAVIDMGIDYYNFPEIKKRMWTGTKLTYGWDYGISDFSQGIDYSYRHSGEYHGTAIALSLIYNPFNKKFSNKIKIIDIVYADYEHNLFNLNKYPFPENNLQVYRRKKAFKDFSNHLGQVFLEAEQQGAKVINFSSGDRGFESELFLESLKSLDKKGVMLITSAGNDGLNLNQDLSYPCSYDLPNLICVGSLTKQNKKSEFSNFGPSVQIYAKGEYGGYLQGTSFAAPIISQAIALIKVKHPRWSNHQVKKELFRFVRIQNSLPIFNHKGFLKYYF